MNREIKFRGKDLVTGKWVYGDLLHPITSCRIVNYTEVEEEGFVQADYHYYDVTPETVGQYTGLKDKNGKDIYEGDILVWYYNDSPSIPLLVEFRYGSFGYMYCENFHALAGNSNFTFNPKGTDERFEIIGNIHDNPKLLKGGNE